MRRATSAIIKGDKLPKRETLKVSPKHSHKTPANQSFDNARSSARSGLTYSKVSDNVSVSDTPDYSPISQSFIKANNEPCEPTKPLKLIAASELVKQFPTNKLSFHSPSDQIFGISKQLAEAHLRLSTKKQQVPETPVMFGEMSDSVSSSSDDYKKPSRAEKLAKLLEEKEKKKKEKLKILRAKRKKIAAKEQKSHKVDTPKKKPVARVESESSPDWQVNKSSKVEQLPF